VVTLLPAVYTALVTAGLFFSGGSELFREYFVGSWKFGGIFLFTGFRATQLLLLIPRSHPDTLLSHPYRSEYEDRIARNQRVVARGITREQSGDHACLLVRAYLEGRRKARENVT
jgi:hypothetical protein